MNILSQNYNNLLSNLDESLCLIARESLITLFESKDKKYSNCCDQAFL